jgi:hypothetical protein
MHADIPKVDSAQMLLPIRSAREIAGKIGLDWSAALKLYDDGWLTFNPETAQITDTGMEAEFLFLGSLVAAGCDPVMLKKLLAGLTKPYRYDMRGVYYAWEMKHWQRFPAIPSPEDSLDTWLTELVDEGDVDALRRIQASVEEALGDLDEPTEDEAESEE